MSVIFVNAGQCGNQLGYCLLDALDAHSGSGEESCLDSFFRESSVSGARPIARAVCIDTEPKVVSECLWRSRKEAKWTYDASNVIYRHGGAGNNWAMGYQMCSGDFLDVSLNCIRRELEFCDQPPLILTLHSVAGGTGSGLGTHMSESACDEFPDVMRMNIAITPYHFGEVVVQHYNSVLSLSKISSASHAVLAFENEVAQELCKKMRKIERPTLGDINHTIASNLLPILLPKYSSSRASPSHLHDDVVSLCSHPTYRFLDVKTTPLTSQQSVSFTFDSWFSLVSTLDKMHGRGTALEQRLSGPMPSSTSDSGGGGGCVRSIGSILTVRGSDAADFVTSSADPLVVNQGVGGRSQRLFAAKNYASLLGRNAVQLYHSGHSVSGYQRSASLLSNSQTILPILQRAASKASDLYRVGAYVHQYSCCGLEQEDFLTSFRSLGHIIDSYVNM